MRGISNGSWVVNRHEQMIVSIPYTFASPQTVISLLQGVPAGSPSRGGDVVVYAFDIN